MEVKVNGVLAECVKGNIADQKGFDAVVNAANARLVSGGGVAGAIHRTAGPELGKESICLGPIRPGEAVITKGYKLPNKHVIHCLGPVYGVDKPSDKILARCYCNALKIAEENKLTSIAFPAISTGVFGYPMEDAARVAFMEIKGLLATFKNVRKIRFVLYKDSYLKIHEKVMADVLRS